MEYLCSTGVAFALLLLSPVANPLLCCLEQHTRSAEVYTRYIHTTKRAGLRVQTRSVLLLPSLCTQWQKFCYPKHLCFQNAKRCPYLLCSLRDTAHSKGVVPNDESTYANSCKRDRMKSDAADYRHFICTLFAAIHLKNQHAVLLRGATTQHLYNTYRAPVLC